MLSIGNTMTICTCCNLRKAVKHLDGVYFCQVCLSDYLKWQDDWEDVEASPGAMLDF